MQTMMEYRHWLSLCVCSTRHIAPPNGVGQTEAKTENQRLMHSHGKARKTYFEKFENSEAVGAITDETFSLWIATSWSVARDYA